MRSTSGLFEMMRQRYQTTLKPSAVLDYAFAWLADRMPPDPPYPAAVDDVVAVYRAALATRAPGFVALSGSSAGGNLVAAPALKARNIGMPLPGALGLFTPASDLTESGDTFHTNRGIDHLLPQSLPEEIALYANGADLRGPRCRPARAICSCRTRCESTGPCAPQALPRTCTYGRQCRTADSASTAPRRPRGTRNSTPFSKGTLASNEPDTWRCEAAPDR